MSLLIVNLGSVCLSWRILLQTLIVKVHLPERRTGSDFQSHTYHLWLASSTLSSSPILNSLLALPGGQLWIELFVHIFKNDFPTLDIPSVSDWFLWSSLSLLWASWSGVLPLLSSVVRAVPALKQNYWPSIPDLSWGSHLRRSVTTGTWLVQAARWRGVFPSLSVWLGSAPCRRSTSTTSE